MLASIKEKKQNFDRLVKSIFLQLKDCSIEMINHTDDKEVDNSVFKVCNQLIREITLYLPFSEAINSISQTLVILEKMKNSQLEPQDFAEADNNVSSQV
jgi:hypothetical protein